MKNFKQCSFSERVQWRIRGLWGLLILMLVYMVVIGELGFGDSRVMTQFAKTFSSITFFGGMVWVGRKIWKNKQLLRNPWKLKEKAIEEKDERNRYLHDKSGGIVWDILFVCLLFVSVTAALINMAAFYTAFALLCVAVVLKTVAYFYYSRCLER